MSFYLHCDETVSLDSKHSTNDYLAKLCFISNQLHTVGTKKKALLALVTKYNGSANSGTKKVPVVVPVILLTFAKTNLVLSTMESHT